MSRVNLDNRVFVAVENTANGTVSSATQFHFWQNGDLYFADYSGGDVREGHIIGQFTGDAEGTMLYHCMTNDNVLKAGKATAKFSKVSEGRLAMDISWKWLTGDGSSGKSRYEEITT